MFRGLDDLRKRVGVAGSDRRDMGKWSDVGCRVLVPAMVGPCCALLVPASVALGSGRVGMPVLDAEIAV